MPTLGLREVNRTLQAATRETNDLDWRIDNPMGAHSLAVGLDAPIKVTVEGHVGFYCGGMNKQAEITVKGHAGPGVGENMMSGTDPGHRQRLPDRPAPRATAASW